MTHALFLSVTGRRAKTLQLHRGRRPAAMVQPLRSARPVQAKVYCDPRMPQGWTEIVD